jgi:hypothetical protein
MAIRHRSGKDAVKRRGIGARRGNAVRVRRYLREEPMLKAIKEVIRALMTVAEALA